MDLVVFRVFNSLPGSPGAWYWYWIKIIGSKHLSYEEPDNLIKFMDEFHYKRLSMNWWGYSKLCTMQKITILGENLETLSSIYHQL